MANLEVAAQGNSKAGIETLWRLVSDAQRYSAWGIWSESGYESGGPNDVGAVRWMQYGRTKTVERIVELIAPSRLVYEVVSGLPVRNYRAVIELTPASSGTHINWSASWDKTLGGRIVHQKLNSLYPEIVDRLIAAADRSIDPSTPFTTQRPDGGATGTLGLD